MRLPIDLPMSEDYWDPEGEAEETRINGIISKMWQDIEAVLAEYVAKHLHQDEDDGA